MKKLLITTAALVALAAPAYASIIDWNFGDHTGLLGTTQTFTAGGDQLLARGFDGGDVGSNLFSKTLGGDENGLGLANDPSGNDEISGLNFIQLNVDTAISEGVSGFNFTMGSTTQGEGWKVFGSDDAHPFQFTLLASSGVDDESDHLLPSGWDNYNFFYTGLPPGQCGDGCNANVLIESFAGTAAAVPELPTWALAGIGFAFLGVVGLRRKGPRFAI